MYRKGLEDVLQLLGTDSATGLSATEVEARLVKYGTNELTEKGIKSPWKILWEQFTATMVLILIGAAVVSGFLGESHETVAIAAIVVLFGVLGFSQEYRAEKAMAALRNLSVPFVRVRRGGTVLEVSSKELVPGDILLLESGNIVPADCRVVESVNLRVQEATLTGESEPVEKITDPLDEADLPLGDRRNMVFMGTIVTFGRGTVVVTDTGMHAELGKIASLIQAAPEEDTPLQRRLAALGKGLAVIGVIMAAVVALLELALRNASIREIFVLGVSVAVAIVPEGLPAVVTFTLAIGARRMLRRKALIRKLPAVETLGSVTVICSDKTGTLTENRMTVLLLDAAGHTLEVRGHDGITHPPEIGLLQIGGMICNDAVMNQTDQGMEYIGDPTETALLKVAVDSGYTAQAVEQALPRIGEMPFESTRKRMTTLHRCLAQNLTTLNESAQHALAPAFQDATLLSFTKGSVDGLMDITSHVWVNDHAEPFNQEWRQRIEASNNVIAGNGMRVLGVGFRKYESEVVTDTDQLERDLIFIGLAGIIDPPRTEAVQAVRMCIEAGIRPVMITGDHPITAQAIAREMGITGDTRVMTGRELSVISDEELRQVANDIRVFARVSPEHKLRIVDALQSTGHIVAMTGDGVNDAPALKTADIGVAMGITGTDVAKEASDMVLLDDNFGTIVAAVEEGRTIYDNVLRFVNYSVTGNIGKVGVMLLAPLFALPLPLQSLQLLWLNLLTDGLLGLGMGMEAPEDGSMQRPPHSPKAKIFSRRMILNVFSMGGFMAVMVLIVGYIYWENKQPQWQTMIFTALAFCQIGQALAARSSRRSALGMNFFANKTLIAMIVGVLLAQLTAVYLPLLQEFFHTYALSFVDLAVCLGCGVMMFIAIEIQKLWLRRRSQSV